MTRMRPFARAWCDPIYRLDVFVVCSKEADFQRALKPMLHRTSLRPRIGDVIEDTGTSLEGCDGRAWTLIHGDQHFAVVWIKPGVDVSVLVHELWHVAFWVFLVRGVTFDAGADEPMAYYLSWLMRRALGGDREKASDTRGSHQ